jgi:7,8-dihydropterin-6-yl-methyl-4-(beta-D-ribofuranosyl)aminobenzene 5'-phosphate synthase
MRLIVIYDNNVYKKDKNLRSDWGFSCLIQEKNDLILFDTGAKGDILLKNMKKLDIDPALISKIIISHEHWDHNGGLEKLRNEIKKTTKIYRLKNNEKEDMNFIFINKLVKISKNIYSTGRLPGDPVDEQSLILKGNKGFFVLVGCSHPGVKNILKIAKEYGNIKGIIGGLHGFSDFKILNKLDLICPLHCTKYKEKIYQTYPDKVIEGGVGKIIDI